MSDVDFGGLTQYAKKLSGLTPEHENTLNETKDELLPHLQGIIHDCHDVPQSVPQAAPFLEGRLDSLSNTHLQWLQILFSHPYDSSHTQHRYKVGDVTVKVKLPVEFMAGAMLLISESLYRVVCKVFASYTAMLERANRAIAGGGHSLMMMQQCYQASSLVRELERFLAITAMSRNLFNNLASAGKD